MNFSQSFSCPDCGISIEEIEPRSFSFNNPFGACPVCHGLGFKMEFDVDLMIPDKNNEYCMMGQLAVLGWQSCTDSNEFIPEQFLMRLCKRVSILIWIRRFEN